MNNQEHASVQIANTLKESFAKERAEGMAEGRRVAEQILLWWSNNEDKAVPHSHDKLIQWSNDALATLRQAEFELLSQ